MARPREATSTLLTKGYDKAHPERHLQRINETKACFPLGDPPRHLEPEVLKCWFDILALYPDGIFQGWDALELEAIAHMMAEYRAAPKDYPSCKLSLYVKSLNRLKSEVRSRAVTLPQDASPFDEFLN